jgi:hypothetical protein
MTALLYFTSIGWILTLFVSATFTACWIFFRLLDAFVRTYLSITEPENRVVMKRDFEPNPHHLKRAGQ